MITMQQPTELEEFWDWAHERWPDKEIVIIGGRARPIEDTPANEEYL